MKKEIQLTATELAGQINVSLVRVGQLNKEGVITKLPNGKYHLSAISEYYEWKIRTNKKTDYSELIDKENYRQKKRQNDLEEKLVAPVSLITDALQKSANQIIPILESLPLVMKRNWPELSGDQILLVKKSIAECRNAIADMEVDVE